MEQIRWGILGTGAIAGSFATGLESLDDATLAAVGSRSAEKAAEFAGRFGNPRTHASYEALANDPEIDIIQTGIRRGPGPCAVEEVNSIRGDYAIAVLVNAEYQFHGGVTFARGCRLIKNGLMLAIGGDEVNDGDRVLHILPEIQPADIRLQLGVAGRGIELCPGMVEARNTRLPATRDIERRQVERQAKQRAAHSLDNELVDFVTNLPGHATNDRASRV